MGAESELEIDRERLSPERLLQLVENQQSVRRAVEALPVIFRETIVLREFEEMSYEEISMVLDVPTGTVMSRLARARKRLAVLLQGEQS